MDEDLTKDLITENQQFVRDIQFIKQGNCTKRLIPILSDLREQF